MLFSQHQEHVNAVHSQPQVHVHAVHSQPQAHVNAVQSASSAHKCCSVTVKCMYMLFSHHKVQIDYLNIIIYRQHACATQVTCVICIWAIINNMVYIDKADWMANNYIREWHTLQWMQKLFFHLPDLNILTCWIMLLSCGAKTYHWYCWVILMWNLIDEAERLEVPHSLMKER